MTNAVLAKLRAFVAGTPVEECELCAEAISVEHEHLLEPDARRVFCACGGCARLLAAGHHEKHDDAPSQNGARYLRVERRALRLTELDFDDAVWAELGVPVGLAFFTMRRRTGEVLATFPGRAGLIESFVPLRAYRELERRFPVLKSIAPDIPLGQIIRGIIPFVVLMLAAVVLICLFPGIANGLPDAVMGSAAGRR
jgi:hypothetical protein